MLHEQTKVVFDDLRGKRNVEMEVLFSEDPELVNTIRVNINGESAIIRVRDLYGFMFVIADAEQQEQLMPVKQTTVRKIVKRHIVKVTRDIRKGENLNVRCETNVPVEVFEGMRGMLDKKKSVPVKTGGLPIIRARSN